MVTVLIIAFSFTSIYATFQSTKDVTAAYADSSSGNNNDCAWWTAGCVAALALAAAACLIPFNPACPGLVIAAAATCATADQVCG